jgi:hypothetical protein
MHSQQGVAVQMLRDAKAETVHAQAAIRCALPYHIDLHMLGLVSNLQLFQEPPSVIL